MKLLLLLCGFCSLSILDGLMLAFGALSPVEAVVMAVLAFVNTLFLINSATLLRK